MSRGITVGADSVTPAGPKDPELPAGWHAGTNPLLPHTKRNPAEFYYTGDGVSQWEVPTQPASASTPSHKTGALSPPASSIAHTVGARRPAAKRQARAKPKARRKGGAKSKAGVTPTFAGIEFKDPRAAAFFDGAEPPWWCVDQALPYIGFIFGVLPAGHPLLQPGRPTGSHAGYGGKTATWQPGWPASWHRDSDGPADLAGAASNAPKRERALPLPRKGAARKGSGPQQAAPGEDGAHAASSALMQSVYRTARHDIRESKDSVGSVETVDAMVAAHIAKNDAEAAAKDAAKEQKQLERDIARAIALSLEESGVSAAAAKPVAAASSTKRGKGKGKAKAGTAGLQYDTSMPDGSTSAAPEGAPATSLKTRPPPKVSGERPVKRARNLKPAPAPAPPHHIPFIGSTVKADWGPDFPDPVTGSTIYTGTVVEYVHGEAVPTKTTASYAPKTELGTVYHGWWKVRWSDGDINDIGLADLFPKLDMVRSGASNSRALVGCKVCKIGTDFNDKTTDGTKKKLMVGCVTSCDPNRKKWTVTYEDTDMKGRAPVTEVVSLAKLEFLFNPVVGLSYTDTSRGAFREGSITKYLGVMDDSDQVAWEVTFTLNPSEGVAGTRTQRVTENNVRAYIRALSALRPNQAPYQPPLPALHGDDSDSGDDSESIILTTTEDGQTPSDLAKIEGFDVDAFVKLNRVKFPTLMPNTRLRIGTGPLVLPK